MADLKLNQSKNIIIVVLVLAILALGGYFLVFNKSASNKATNTQANDKYQAVFLTNGQVYFGKLKDQDDKYVKLTDIYYLQAKDADKVKQETAQTQDPNLTLIKLGKELHAPADEMNINRDQLLFWEDIKDDGKVMQAIKEYKQSDKK